MLESEPHHEILMAFATHCLSFRHERLDDLQLLYRLLDNDDLNPQRGIDAVSSPPPQTRGHRDRPYMPAPPPTKRLPPSPHSPVLLSRATLPHLILPFSSPLTAPSELPQLRQGAGCEGGQAGQRRGEAEAGIADPARPVCRHGLRQPARQLRVIGRHPGQSVDVSGSRVEVREVLIVVSRRLMMRM